MSELDLEPPTPPQQKKIPSDLQLSLAQLKACSPQSADPQVDIFQISIKNTEYQFCMDARHPAHCLGDSEVLWHDNGLVVLETNHSEGQSFSTVIEAVFIPLYVNFAQSCYPASSADYCCSDTICGLCQP